MSDARSKMEVGADLKIIVRFFRFVGRRRARARPSGVRLKCVLKTGAVATWVYEWVSLEREGKMTVLLE